MIDRTKVALFIPAGLKDFKLRLFERIGSRVGKVIRYDVGALDRLPPDIVPIVGCMPELTAQIKRWQETGRDWIYWDRGYCRRIFATDLPRGTDGGMYRWHRGGFQMQRIINRPDDRWRSCDTPLWPWKNSGRHIVVAMPSPTYQRFHAIEGWLDRTLAQLKAVTDRPLVVRDKEMQRSGRKLHQDLAGAHCLVTHASNAAVEAAIMGCPVYVDPASAAALVGHTVLDSTTIENPVYPDREPWVRSLAYCQFNERELIDGTLWSLLE